MKSKSVRPLVASVLIAGSVWCAVNVVTACTPKREAAAADLAKRDANCAVADLNRSPAQMLLDCAVPHDSAEVQDLIDLLVGAQAAAVKSGASLPKAGIAADAGH